MIYLDGSRFFFDIEGCFSKSIEQAREQNKNLPGDKTLVKRRIDPPRNFAKDLRKFPAQRRKTSEPERIIPLF